MVDELVIARLYQELKSDELERGIGMRTEKGEPRTFQ